MEEISLLRKEIDKIDEKILLLIKRRIKVAKEIGVPKKKNDLPIKDIEREKKLLNSLLKKAEENNLDEKLVKKIWKELIRVSYKIERKI